MAYFKCSGGTNPTGNATEGDVLATKTFSNADGTDKVGTMPNRGAVSISLNASTTSYTIPDGYHNGSGKVSITTQTKSADPSTSAQTISPDSGKLLSSVSISAISPQRSAGTSAVASGIDSTSPYVYIPYGWYPSGGNSRQYVRMTAAQAVAACPSQTKTVTSSRSAQTVTPDSGKLLSSVTVNALAPTGTYTASSRGASLDMGASSNYRYVNTNSVPNTNSGTYTFAANDTGGTKDLGATNTYRYVNAANVYAKGKADGAAYTNTFAILNVRKMTGNNACYFYAPSQCNNKYIKSITWEITTDYALSSSTEIFRIANLNNDTSTIITILYSDGLSGTKTYANGTYYVKSTEYTYTLISISKSSGNVGVDVKKFIIEFY